MFLSGLDSYVMEINENNYHGTQISDIEIYLYVMVM